MLAALAKRAATNVPTTNATGKHHLHRLRGTTGRPGETFPKSEIFGSAVQQTRGGLGLFVKGDDVQLEQLLINLVRNAVDASMETNGRVEVGWQQKNGQVEVWIRDEGPGLASTANLFVPFFTTKAQGSGIGLVLSRQIAEAHGGTLTLENRQQLRGCEARLRLPL